MSDLTAGRELNRRIAREVMGWLEWTGDGDWTPPVGQEKATMFTAAFPWDESVSVYEDGEEQMTFYFEPSRKIADAWLVVEKMREQGYSVDINTTISNKGWYVVLSDDDGHEGDEGGTSLPLAICKAALAAAGAAPLREEATQDTVRNKYGELVPFSFRDASDRFREFIVEHGPTMGDDQVDDAFDELLTGSRAARSEAGPNDRAGDSK